MTPHEFQAKWHQVTLTERAACQQHFLDLCELLGQPKPAAADPEGSWYCFERGARKTSGGSGWADVWMRGHFGWEYKGKHKDLRAAYNQLLQYREDLENPPLLVVCDMDRFEVHTNFTGTAKRVFAFDLDGLAEPENLDVLRRMFTHPETLRPGVTARTVTEHAAELFGQVADGMRGRGVPPQDAAHFLMKLMFCMFADHIDLLPNQLFSRLLTGAKKDPQRLSQLLKGLFVSMSTGGLFGVEEILYFNGGLFADSDVIDLTPREIDILTTVNQWDWSVVEPSIFGTLFERMLDPAKRSQIGAHYTSREDIETLLKPVMMVPLRREWEEVKAKCEALRKKLDAKPKRATKRISRGGKSKERKQLERLLLDFVERLAHVTVLDPACGSGNFLYVALHLLMNLEKEVITYAAGVVGLLPQVRPTQLAGFEINPYAQQLAQVAIWIGYLQWICDNGFRPRKPVLEPIESIRLRDAIVDLTDPTNPQEPEWPDAEFIVSNPPFLGGKLLRTHLGDEVVNALFRVWNNRVPREADLCCYWFEKARGMVEAGRAKRVGLLATQGIRGGANRAVLRRIKETGDIFFAESDRDWVLDGAHVHVSMVGFDAAIEKYRQLDGHAVAQINANLTSTIIDLATAERLNRNLGVAFMADTKGGEFDISETLAHDWLRQPNPSGRPNSDVLRPWVNGLDVTGRSRSKWIIDFGCDMPLQQSALYEKPFEHVRKYVRPTRQQNKRAAYRERWWLHVEPRRAMRDGLAHRPRMIATPNLTKHRLFVFLDTSVLPDHQLIVFTRDDDYFFGVLQSRAHEVWARAQGTQLRERESGFRYTPTTCFETFPFPQPTAKQEAAIAAAARELDRLRNAWLNPPDWVREEVLTFPGAADGPWARFVREPDANGIGTVHFPRVKPKDEEHATLLKKRTLTNLYNERPAWLQLAQDRLDAAVQAAYGWPDDMGEEDILAKLLERNLARRD